MRTDVLHLPALMLMAAGMSVAHSADPPPKFKITTKRDTDKCVVTVEKQSTIFSLHSPLGISQASIERTADRWPENVGLRLHLNGLERFQIQSGETSLNASVSSQKPHTPVRLWKNTEEDKPLDSTSPLWMEIRSLGSDGTPATEIPLKNGYFEMQLPKTLLDSNPQSITVSWIDFYRT